MEPITASKVAFGGVKDVLNLDFPQRLIDDTIHKSPIYMGFMARWGLFFNLKIASADIFYLEKKMC